VGCLLLLWFFNKVPGVFLRQGIIVGISWLIINWLLDFIILIPMSKIGYGDYFLQIGLRYLVMPTISVSIGYTLQNKEG